MQNKVNESSKAKVVSIDSVRGNNVHTGMQQQLLITALLQLGYFFLSVKMEQVRKLINKSPNVKLNNLSEQEIIEFLKTNASPCEDTSASLNTTMKEHEIKKFA